MEFDGPSQGKTVTSTHEKNRKYVTSYLRFQNSCATILVIATCDFFMCTCDFFHICEKILIILAIYIASMFRKIASMEGKKAERHTFHKYVIDENHKYVRYISQVCQVQIKSMSGTNRKYHVSDKSQVCQVQITSMSPDALTNSVVSDDITAGPGQATSS